MCLHGNNTIPGLNTFKQKEQTVDSLSEINKTRPNK